MDKLNITRANRDDWESMGVNPSFGWAYLKNLEAGNEVLNIEEFYLTEHIFKIIENCKKFGIKEITLSGCAGDLKNLALFEENGCRMAGLTKVKSYHKDIHGEQEIITAMKMIID